MSDTVTMFVHDCKVDLDIGVLHNELGRLQPVTINVECEAVLDRRYDDIKDDNWDHIISYHPIYHFIHDELTKMGHIHFLESAAELITDFCFRDARVQKVRVRLEKTAVFPSAAGAGVETVRTRA